MNGKITGICVTGSKFKYKNLGKEEAGEDYFISNKDSSRITQLPGVNNEISTDEDNSHRLTYKSGFEALNSGLILCDSWTSTSVDWNNTLETDIVTAIQGVKGYNLNRCEIVRGSGSTGGDLLKAINSSSSFGLNVRYLSNKTYRILLRYAANNSNTLNIICSDAGINTSITIPKTGDISNDDFPYELFGYLDILFDFKTNPTNQNYKDYKFDFTFYNSYIHMDRFKFVPITEVLIKYDANRKVELEVLEKQLTEL